MKRVVYVIAIILFVILMIFAVSNSHEIRVYYWPDRALPLMGHEAPIPGTQGMAGEEEAMPAKPVPVFVVIFGCFGLGFLTSWVVGLGPYFRLRTRARRSRRELRKTVKELDRLRAQIDAAEPPEPPQPPPPDSAPGETKT